MFVSTKGGDTKAVKMSRKQAMDLKRDPNVTNIDTAKGQDLKEEGVKFSKEETAAIAKEVGRGVAKRKYDTWPSAYASGAVVRCRRGEIWKKEK